tara:strand:+ start:738 stop:1085 length:348 start_codon:yes stop_codon:yes gene_type:complete
MTMHLLPSYYTTTSFKKRKGKKKTAAIIQEELKLQKLLKRVGYQKDSGYRPDLPDYQVSKTNDQLSNNVGNGFKRTTKQYTGDEILGFGVLHKSNVVPIRKDSNDAKEIARMRRG